MRLCLNFSCLLFVFVIEIYSAEFNSKEFLINSFAVTDLVSIPQYEAEFIRIVYRQPLSNNEISKKIERRAEMLGGLNEEEIERYRQFFREDFPELVFYEKVIYTPNNYIVYRTRQLEGKVELTNINSFPELAPTFYYENFVYDLKNDRFYNTDNRMKRLWVTERVEEYSGKYFDFMVLPEQWFGGIRSVIDFDESKDKRIQYSSFTKNNDSNSVFNNKQTANITFPSKHYYKIGLDPERAKIQIIQHGFDSQVNGTHFFHTYQKFDGWDREFVVDYEKSYNKPQAGVVAERIMLSKIRFMNESNEKSAIDVLNSLQGYKVHLNDAEDTILGEIGKNYQFTSPN